MCLSSKVTLQWPTSLAINPVDQSVYILDGDVIVQLSGQHDVPVLSVVVAGARAPCVLTSQLHVHVCPVVVDWQHDEPQDIAVTPTGRQLVVVDQRTVRAVDLLTGHVTRYVSTLCGRAGNVSLSAVSVNHDGVIYVTDVISDNIYTVTSQLPAPHHVTGNYDVMDPTTQHRYTFNRWVNMLGLYFTDSKYVTALQ